MALTFKLEEAQAERLITAISDRNDAIEQGFAALIGVLSGQTEAELQQLIDQHASQIRAARERLQSAINRNKLEGD